MTVGLKGLMASITRSTVAERASSSTLARPAWSWLASPTWAPRSSIRCAGDALAVPEPPVVLDPHEPANDPGLDVRVCSTGQSERGARLCHWAAVMA